MNKRHVAMVIARYPPTIGGTELQCRGLSKMLAKRGYTVSVLTELHDPRLPARETQEGVTIYRFNVGSLPFVSTLRFGLCLRSWIETHSDVTLLHAHMLAGPTLAAFYWGRRLKKPVILKIAGAGPTGDIGTSKQHWQGGLKLWLFRKWAGLVACPNPRTLEEIKSLGIPSNQLRLIPNGVQTDRFKPLPQAEKTKLRDSLQINPNDRVALYVGRWAEGKGVETLLSIWEKAKGKQNFDWNLILVISQPVAPAQQARVNALGRSVRMIIGAADPLSYYQAADLAVLMSENEGLSNFLLEAMAAGLPLLTTRGAAVSSAEESVAWSWFAPSENADILFLLNSIPADPTTLKTKGAAARTKAVSTFSLESVAQAYENLYEEALA